MKYGDEAQEKGTVILHYHTLFIRMQDPNLWQPSNKTCLPRENIFSQTKDDPQEWNVC